MKIDSATHLYNLGYEAGHHDTVESQYTHIVSHEMQSYHADVVQDILSDKDAFPPQATAPDLEAVELLRRTSKINNHIYENDAAGHRDFNILVDAIDAYLARHGKNNLSSGLKLSQAETLNTGLSPDDTKAPLNHPEGHSYPPAQSSLLSPCGGSQSTEKVSTTQSIDEGGSNPRSALPLSDEKPCPENKSCSS